jgi:hypothetical protein
MLRADQYQGVVVLRGGETTLCLPVSGHAGLVKGESLDGVLAEWPEYRWGHHAFFKRCQNGGYPLGFEPQPEVRPADGWEGHAP